MRAIGLFLAVLPGLGCLDAPSPGGEGPTDAVDGGIAGDAGEVDASGGSCQVIVRDRFDDSGHWVSVAPPGSVVERQPTWARVRATPSPDDFVYGDLHTVQQAAIEGTTLSLTVEGPIVSVTGQVGVSWDFIENEEEDDYYHLAVSDGNLRALHKPSAGEEVEVCTTACPSYSRFEHARLQLREEDGYVIYESAPAAGPWVEIGRAPASGLPYQAILFAEATGPGSGDLTVTGADWVDCGE